MEGLKIKTATVKDLKEIIQWVPSAKAAKLWGGDKISFPIDCDILQKEIAFSENLSYSLCTEESLVGFSQVVKKSSVKAHLAKIIINPGFRGQQMGRLLLNEMVKICDKMSFKQISLNVYMENIVALKLYESLGFRVNRSDHNRRSLNMILELSG